MTIDVARARADTPGCDDVVHLNNAGAALRPTVVTEAVVEHLTLEDRIGGYEAAARASERIEHTYDAIAALISCEPSEVALVENATRAWDMAFYDWGKKSKFKSQRRSSDLIFLFDMTRGVEVLRLKGGAAKASKMRKVTAPSRKTRDRYAAKMVGSLAQVSNADGSVSYVCPLFE